MLRPHQRTAALVQLTGCATLAAMSVMSGCGGGGSDAVTPAQPPAKGTIAVSLATNAPACGFDAVTLSLAKVRFHRDVNADAGGAGWEELLLAPDKPVNLIHAPGAGGSTVALGELALPAGLYTQAILVPAIAAPVARRAGTTAAVTFDTPGNYGAGTRLPLDLHVAEGQTSPVVLDLDSCTAVQPRGAGFVFKPRTRAVPASLNGITGYLGLAAQGKLAVVTAQRSGAIHATAVSDPATGAFALTRLEPGNYDVVVQAPGLAAAVIGKVPVTASGYTSVSSATAPLLLPAGDSSAIAGRVTYTAPATVAPDGTWVAVSQTIPANLAIGRTATIVTYRLQSADVDSGVYQVGGLPRGALQYAAYQATLPLALTPLTTQLGNGHFRVETVATGYGNKTSTPSSNVDVSGANAAAIDIAITLP